MSDIKRYNLSIQKVHPQLAPAMFSEEAADGAWCLYADHSAELTRLRKANAALRAECVAWRAYEAFIEDGAKSNTESANHHDRIGECRQLTDSTPGAMEGNQ